MNGLFVLAQAAANVDPNAIGVSVTSLAPVHERPAIAAATESAHP